MLGRRGIVFTVDAMFALAVTIPLIMTCFVIVSSTTPQIYNSKDLYMSMSDSLAVLDEDYTLRDAVTSGGLSTIQSYLNSLPSNMCANITIYSSASMPVLSARTAGCTQSNFSSVAIRHFLANTNTYYATMRGWYR